MTLVDYFNAVELVLWSALVLVGVRVRGASATRNNKTERRKLAARVETACGLALTPQ